MDRPQHGLTRKTAPARLPGGGCFLLSRATIANANANGSRVSARYRAGPAPFAFAFAFAFAAGLSGRALLAPFAVFSVQRGHGPVLRFGHKMRIGAVGLINVPVAKPAGHVGNRDTP